MSNFKYNLPVSDVVVTFAKVRWAVVGESELGGAVVGESELGGAVVGVVSCDELTGLEMIVRIVILISTIFNWNQPHQKT